MSEIMKVHYDVNGDDFENAGEVSRSVKKLLKQLGIAPDVIRRVAIAMYEGEINMVIHAYGGSIDVEITPEKVYFELSDKGPGIPDVKAALTEGFSTADSKVRELGFGAGMGLPNMKKYSDDMQIETRIGEGTTVKITVNI